MNLRTYLMIKQGVYNIPGPSPVYSLPNMQFSANSNVDSTPAPTNLGSLADWREIVDLAKEGNPDEANTYDAILTALNAVAENKNNS